MTMNGYLTALVGRYDHIRGESFDWGSPDHAMRAVLAYLLACERRMQTDISEETRALASAATLELGSSEPLTINEAASLQEQLLFLHQTSSPVSRLLLQIGDLHTLSPDARRALLNSEVSSLGEFLDDLRRITDKPDVAAAKGVSAGAGEIVEIGKDEVAQIAASSDALRDLAVELVTPIVGGMSKVTNRCTLVSTDGVKTSVVVRIDTSAGYSKSSVSDEFRLLRRLHASGVAVPVPLASGKVRSGAAAIIVSSVDGAMFGTPFDTMIHSPSLCRQMGAHLASIHRVDTSGLDLQGTNEDPKVGVAADIAFVEMNWRRIGKPEIVIECALDWLKENIDLIAGEPSLVHGDYGVHNLLQANETINAVLDWEFAKVGNPIEDLGFVFPVAQAVDSWDTFLQGYVDEGGTAPGQQQLNYFVILGLTRLAIMMGQSHDIFRKHGHFMAGVPGAFLQPRLLSDLGNILLEQSPASAPTTS